MSNKRSTWNCDQDDKRELKRIALELGDLNQEEAFGRAVAALRTSTDLEKLVQEMGKKHKGRKEA
jgi:hypothetical protein